MKIQCLTSWDEVHACAPQWQALLARCGAHPVFSSADWFLAYLKAFPRYQAHVLLLEDAGQLCAIAPLVRDTTNQRLCFIDALADYQDFIVADHQPQYALHLLQACLRYPSGQLRGVRHGAALQRASKRYCSGPSMHFPMPAARAASTCYFVALSADYTSYLQTRSANFRFNLRKAGRRAAALGMQACQLQADQYNGNDVVEAFLRLHLLRFPGRLFSHPAIQAFCRDLLPTLYQRGALKVFALLHGERIQALQLSLRDHHSLALWNGGFDPQLAPIAPGKLLLQEQLRYCAAQHLPEFDFLRGDESYKQAWSSAYRLIGELSW